MSETRLPTVQWAQRSDKLYLTIDLQEAENTKIELTNGDDGGKVSFSGTARSHAAGSEEHKYALQLDLYAKIDEAESKIAVGARSIVLVIAKSQPEFWPRLLHATGKTPRNIQIDWNRWVDEDEEEEKGDFDLSGLQNMQNYGMDGGGGMGGMPGMGGMGGGGGMPDMAEMMKSMGAGGMGAGGTPDMQEMLKKIGASGGAAGLPDDGSDSEDNVPPLE